MKAREYYDLTRLIETKNWTLGMAMAFADEYHKVKTDEMNKHRPKLRLCGQFLPEAFNKTICVCGREEWEHPKIKK